jgi:hypothetical protein
VRYLALVDMPKEAIDIVLSENLIQLGSRIVE